MLLKSFFSSQIGSSCKSQSILLWDKKEKIVVFAYGSHQTFKCIPFLQSGILFGALLAVIVWACFSMQALRWFQKMTSNSTAIASCKCIFQKCISRKCILFFKSVFLKCVFFESVFVKCVFVKSVFLKCVFVTSVFVKSVFSKKKGISQSAALVSCIPNIPNPQSLMFIQNLVYLEMIYFISHSAGR